MSTHFITMADDSTAKKGFKQDHTESGFDNYEYEE